MTERIIIAVLALTAFSLADGPVQPVGIEPIAILGFNAEGPFATFVWAINADGTLGEGFTVQGDHVRGSPAVAWMGVPNGEQPSLQQMLGVSDEQLLLGLRQTMDPNDMIEILGIGGCAGDTNGDGVVDLRDLNLVMANFGKVCD